MKIKVLFNVITILLIISITAFNSQGQGKSKAQFKDQMDSISYIVGVLHANNLKQQNVQVKPDMLLLGLTDVLSGKELLISGPDRERTMREFHMNKQAQQQAEMTKIAAINREKGTQFLAENKNKKDISELPSGLQYRIIKPGSGDSPKLTDKVTVHYRGTLLDGTKFDASYDRNKPATFVLSGVIKGWQEGLQLMKLGAIYQFYIPADLAYGDKAAGPIIQAGATLIFEIELISIEPGDSPVKPTDLQR